MAGSKPAPRLNHVHLVAGAAFGADAVAADAGDDQAVTGDAELVLAAKLVAQFLQLLVFKFEQLIALGAMEVVVLRITVVVLVNRPAVKDEFA